MSSSTQPDLTNDNGVVLTVGIVSNSDRCCIVLPIATDNTSLDDVTRCKDAVTSFAAIIAQLQACISSDAYISFIQGEGMTDGMIPNRQDFTITTYLGTRDAPAAPSQVAALIIFYRDPAHALTGERMKIGKNFIPGLAQNDLSGDHVVAGLGANLQTFADTLQNGFNSSGGGGSQKWYRYLNTPVPRTTGTHLKAVTGQTQRGYVATQRRRLVPR